MKRFLTFFHEDHVHVGAAAAEAASGSRRDVDLTMVSKTIVNPREAFVSPLQAGEIVSIYPRALTIVPDDHKSPFRTGMVPA